MRTTMKNKKRGYACYKGPPASVRPICASCGDLGPEYIVGDKPTGTEMLEMQAEMARVGWVAPPLASDIRCPVCK